MNYENAIATITVVSKGGRKVIERVTRIRHSYSNLVSGDMHLHLNEGYCLEILIARGSLERIMEFIDRIKTVKGVWEGKYTLVPI